MQIGELQCYDRRALASLAQAAQEKGHPEWGYTGPHDAGMYTSTPEVPPAVYHPLTDAAWLCFQYLLPRCLRLHGIAAAR